MLRKLAALTGFGILSLNQCEQQGPAWCLLSPPLSRFFSGFSG
jgi:hypothetical protein